MSGDDWRHYCALPLLIAAGDDPEKALIFAYALQAALRAGDERAEILRREMRAAPCLCEHPAEAPSHSGQCIRCGGSVPDPEANDE